MKECSNTRVVIVQSAKLKGYLDYKHVHLHLLVHVYYIQYSHQYVGSLRRAHCRVLCHTQPFSSQ